jgi:DNA-binding transcriptional MerR regulator
MGSPIFGYTRKEVEQITGMPGRRIQFYTDNAVVIPQIEDPKGRGGTRRYSTENVFDILVINELSKYGVPLGKVKEIMSYLQDNPHIDEAGVPHEPGPFYLMIYGGGAEGFKLSQVTQKYRLYLEGIMKGFSSVVVIDLSSLAKQVPEIRVNRKRLGRRR